MEAAVRMTCPSPTSTPEELERRAIIQRNDLILHEAVIKNDAETVRRILKEPVDINCRNNVSNTHPILIFPSHLLLLFLFGVGLSLK